MIPNGVHLSIVSQRIVAGMNSFVLLAIPLFTITGYLMEHTSLSRRLVEFIEGWIGGIRGSAGIVTIIACAIFAALTAAHWARSSRQAP